MGPDRLALEGASAGAGDAAFGYGDREMVRPEGDKALDDPAGSLSGCAEACLRLVAIGGLGKIGLRSRGHRRALHQAGWRGRCFAGELLGVLLGGEALKNPGRGGACRCRRGMVKLGAQEGAGIARGARQIKGSRAPATEAEAVERNEERMGWRHDGTPLEPHQGILRLTAR